MGDRPPLECVIMIGLPGSGAPCSSASKTRRCVTAWNLCALSHRICAAKSAGLTVSRCVIAGNVGLNTSTR